MSIAEVRQRVDVNSRLPDEFGPCFSCGLDAGPLWVNVGSFDAVSQPTYSGQSLTPTLHLQQAIFCVFAVGATCINLLNKTTVKRLLDKSKMAARKKTNPAKAARTGKAPGSRKKSKPKSPPKIHPRPRVLCPGCSTELLLHKTPANSQDFVYASMTDMKKLGIECKNESCALYIEGVGDADDKLPVNPAIEKCLADAKVDRAAIKVVKKKEKAEKKMKKRDEREAVYAPYNPHSGAKDKEAKEASKRRKKQLREAKKIMKAWKKIGKATEKLEKLETLEKRLENPKNAAAPLVEE